LFFQFIQVVDKFGIFLGSFVDLINFPEDGFLVGLVDLEQGFLKMDYLFGDLIDVFIVLLKDFGSSR
jgi:hypothetical protein